MHDGNKKKTSNMKNSNHNNEFSDKINLTY